MSDYLKYHQRNILTSLGVVFPCNHLYNFDAFIFMLQFSLKVGKTFIYTSMCSNMCCVCSIMSTLYDPVNCNPPGPFVCGIFWARILEWIAILFSRGSSQPRWSSLHSCTSCILAGRFFSNAPSGKPHAIKYLVSFMKSVSPKLHKYISFLLMHSWWLFSHGALKYIKSRTNASTLE